LLTTQENELELLSGTAMNVSEDIYNRLVRGRFGCLLLAAVTWCGGFVAFVLIARTLSGTMNPVAAAFVSSILCMGVAVFSIAILTKGWFHFQEAVGLFASGVVVNLVVYNVFSGLAARLVLGFSLIAAGCGMGALLAGMVESPRYIVPMCVVAALADTWSAIAGPTKRIIEGPPGIVLNHAFVSVPVTADASEIQHVAGVTDLVFVALFLCLASRLGLSVRRAVVGILIGLAVGLAAACAVGGVPGLPFLGGGFVLAHWRSVRPGRGEMIKTSIFIAFMLAVFAVLAAIR
jgi:hypothetical protein